jgi:hypothetical protein
MRRSYGPLSSKLLDALRETGKLSSFDLTHRVFDVADDLALTEAQGASVRRALAKLARQGEVVRLYREYHTNSRVWELSPKSSAHSSGALSIPN